MPFTGPADPQPLGQVYPTYTHPSRPGQVGTILPIHEADQITGRVIGDDRRAQGFVLVSWNSGSNIKEVSWFKPEELSLA